MIDEVEKRFAAAGAPVTFIKVHHQPDGHFPNGIPNPLLPECRRDTADAVRVRIRRTWVSPLTATSTAASCSMTRRRLSRVLHCRPAGGSVPAEAAGAKIIHDPRLTWNTVDIVTRSGGQPVMSKTGMRSSRSGCAGRRHLRRGDERAPLLPRLRLLRQRDDPVAAGGGAAVPEEQLAEIAGGGPPGGVPGVGEINRKLGNAAEAIARIRAQYEPAAAHIDTTDGISIEYPEWRFNLRTSNTEPVVRLNVESRADTALMNAKPKRF